MIDICACVVMQPKLLPELRLVELQRVHSEWVRQVSFYSSLHCVVSCATCLDSLLMCDVAGSRTHNMFRVDKVYFKSSYFFALTYIIFAFAEIKCSSFKFFFLIS